jgi:Zn-finger nucleic acid-binding protein
MPNDRSLKYPCGAPCEVCGRGRLHPIIMPNIPTYGGHPPSILACLRCSNCKGNFPAKNAGLDLAGLREAKLVVFRNPPQKPDRCPKCSGPLCFDHTAHPPSGLALRREDLGIAYDYCPICNLIVWLDNDERDARPAMPPMKTASIKTIAKLLSRRHKPGSRPDGNRRPRPLHEDPLLRPKTKSFLRELDAHDKEARKTRILARRKR